MCYTVWEVLSFRISGLNFKATILQGAIFMEIQLWRSILCPYELAVRELEVKFNHIIDECKENDVYCPIEQVEGRVKSVSSILEKMQRKHIPMERMEEELEDIAGVRIICQFEEDIETVASLIQKRSDMVIKSEKNYLKHIKQSGYRSLHLIIYYTVETLNGPRKLQAEIQIRTMAMDFWATIEHSLQYKYKGDMPPHVAERLTNAADAIILLDQEMSSVRDEIMDAQNSSQMQSNLVKDILNNIENLYRVSSEREITKIQTEFLRVFHTKDLKQLERFHRQLDIIAEGYRAQAVYHNIGHQPGKSCIS